MATAKSNLADSFRQLSLFEYTPASDELLEVNDRTLYGHLLDYQLTAEFRAELAAQLSLESSIAKKEASKQGAQRYRQRYPHFIRRRTILRKNKHKLRAHLIEQQKGQCYYCRCELDETAQIDHKRAMVRGGSDDLSNLALVCAWCNQHKSTLSESRWRRRMVKIVRTERRYILKGRSA